MHIPCIFSSHPSCRSFFMYVILKVTLLCLRKEAGIRWNRPVRGASACGGRGQRARIIPVQQPLLSSTCFVLGRALGSKGSAPRGTGRLLCALVFALFYPHIQLHPLYLILKSYYRNTPRGWRPLQLLTYANRNRNAYCFSQSRIL